MAVQVFIGADHSRFLAGARDIISPNDTGQLTTYAYDAANELITEQAAGDTRQLTTTWGLPSYNPKNTNKQCARCRNRLLCGPRRLPRTCNSAMPMNRWGKSRRQSLPGV